QRIDDRLRHRVAKQGSVDIDFGRIALSDDLAVMDDDDRLGTATGAAIGLGEGAVECGLELIVLRRDHVRPADVRQDGRDLLVPVGIHDRRDVFAIVPDHAAGLTSIYGVTVEVTQEVDGHFLAQLVDVVADAAVEHADAARRAQCLAVDLIGIETRDESRRAERVGDVFGRDADGAIRPVLHCGEHCCGTAQNNEGQQSEQYFTHRDQNFRSWPVVERSYCSWKSRGNGLSGPKLSATSRQCKPSHMVAGTLPRHTQVKRNENLPVTTAQERTRGARALLGIATLLPWARANASGGSRKKRAAGFSTALRYKAGGSHGHDVSDRCCGDAV